MNRLCDPGYWSRALTQPVVWLGLAVDLLPIYGVIAWGWLWGIWGLLLGVPILMIVKAVCDRVDDLKPIGELLGT